MKQIIPSTAQVIDIARQANARHLHIVTDGNQTMLCPEQHIPPGWYKISVRVKQARAA